MRQPIRTILILILLGGLLGAQEFRKSGTSGFIFLELPVTARYAGLGEAGISVPDAESDGLFVNPALTAYSESRFSASLSHANWYVDTDHQAAGLTWRTNAGVFGAQIVYFDFGEVARTQNFIPGIFEPGAGDDLPYAEQGTYTAGAYAFGLTAARRLTDRFGFGASVKYVREEIDIYDASNLVVDLGFVYLTAFHSLRVGAFLQNFGLESEYIVEKFRMPQQLKMELSAEVLGSLDGPNRLTVITSALHPTNSQERFHLGVESVLIDALVLRGGYKFGYDEENLTLGAGLRFAHRQKRVRLDLAYMKHDQLDTTLRTTLAFDL